METQRQLKISRLLQRELGEIFQRDAKAKYGGAMITVTKVNVSKDMSVARVYLSLFATNDKSGLISDIEAHSHDTRYQLGKRIRNQVRIIPQIRFLVDESLDYFEKYDKLLEH